MNPATSTHELPGPTGWHLVGAFASLLQGDLLKPFVRLFERYGPMFRIPLPPGQDLVMLAHPDAAEQVLRSRQQNYRKGSVYDGARLLLGNGLVTSEGDYRRRQRSLANPAFRPAKLEQYLETMGACTRALTGSWTPLAGSAPIDAQAEMTRLTLAIAGRNTKRDSNVSGRHIERLLPACDRPPRLDTVADPPPQGRSDSLNGEPI